MDNRTIEEIRKNETELIKILDYQTDKLDQYKNNWEELKTELKTAYSEIFEHELVNGRELIKNILNKMKELEEVK